MRMRKALVVLSVAVVVTSLVHAAARKPEDVFGGRILVSDQPFPTSAASADAYIGAIKKTARDRIIEDKETKQWRIFFAAFFKQPANDLEVTVHIYDVSSGARQHKQSFEQYLASPTTRAYVSHIELPHGTGTGGYDPNTKLQLVLETRGRVLAETTFVIVGDAPKKGPQNIDFSAESSK
jgi:hypothetical protein